MDLNAWLQEVRLVVCVGSGGVGKTTTAATIGLQAALAGRRAMVLTIDPAKRLANSLGLDQLGGEPRQVDLSSLGDVDGELWGMMLDSRGTFDALIDRIAPNADVLRRLKDNHIYQHMADALAGSQEYMATEKLYDLSRDDRFDLIVLDTPPVKNALDFLESPGRVARFLDRDVLGRFMPRPGGGASRLFRGTQTVLYRMMGLVFGKAFLDDFTQFLDDFAGLYDGFRERHEAVVGLFRATGTDFVTVCAPNELSMDIARYFQSELARRDLPRGGVIVNKVHTVGDVEASADEALADVVEHVGGATDESTAQAVVGRLGEAYDRLRAVVDAERRRIEDLRDVAGGGGFLREIPRLHEQVYDLPALQRIAELMFSTPAESL